MARSTVIGEAAIPYDGGTMRLLQGKDDFTIVLSGIAGELMSTRRHGSEDALGYLCLLYTSPSPRDGLLSRMPSSA